MAEQYGFNPPLTDTKITPLSSFGTDNPPESRQPHSSEMFGQEPKCKICGVRLSRHGRTHYQEVEPSNTRVPHPY